MKAAKAGIDLGIVVTDHEPMLAFYSGVLGLEVVGERTTGWGTMVELAFGETVLRLLKPAADAAPSDGGMLAVTGFRYLTFPIEPGDFDATLAACVAAGAPVTSAEMRAGEVRFVIVADPEGNSVELLSRGA
ncbi:VOC family protein [Subtercola endophyticus]|uniref:VOC family protein n=1 Tax=Subtercola endophyticus TaxID=2895559 RepID=UPI001E5EF8A2|nr:VOC family protein [Subtercola endophyticus]UFS58674.1 VOC family protein [Subtercola endophyticus]